MKERRTPNSDRRMQPLQNAAVPEPEKATRLELHLRAALMALREDPDLETLTRGDVELRIWKIIALLGCPDAVLMVGSKYESDTDDGDVRCHRGHVTMASLWNCPACTDAILDAVRRGMLEEAKSISDEINEVHVRPATTVDPKAEVNRMNEESRRMFYGDPGE